MNDMFQIIDRPMDFSTIKNQMEAKDGTGYKHVREIYSDVRLVFKNAIKYNDEKSDVHRMAKKLLELFEEKWLKFLPKVTEEVIISGIWCRHLIFYNSVSHMHPLCKYVLNYFTTFT